MNAIKIGLACSATLALTGCFSTGEQRIREMAYQSCSDEKGDALQACMQREVADIGYDWQSYAARYQEDMDRCESDRTLAGSAGVDPDVLSCSRNLGDYVLRGGPR